MCLHRSSKVMTNMKLGAIFLQQYEMKYFVCGYGVNDFWGN